MSSPPTHPPTSLLPPSHPMSPNQFARVLAQAANERTVIYFTASITALSVIIITAHFVSEVSSRLSSKGKQLPASKYLDGVGYVRSCLLFKVPLFSNIGQALVFAAYIIINISLLVQNMDLSQPKYWAKRLGWITTCNIALITFLALKNTPLAFLTSYSYERLNILHQAAGCCTVFFAILHTLLWIVFANSIHSLSLFLEKDNIMGIVAGISMLIMLTTALTLRKFRYEAFYITHIIMFMLILIVAGMHRPELSTKSTYITIFAACIWVLDRIIRGTRVISYSFGNRATIHPLPHGGVRIVMRRTPWRAVPGTHVFLWIPKVRAMETHPFTIVSTNPLELVVSPHDGFTRDLSSLASKTPGAVLRASSDGPYGTLPNFGRFDQVVLVAGGSGATFTFGVALNLLRKMSDVGTKPMIQFIWVIRDYEMQKWFHAERTELIASPLVDFKVYVTGSTDTDKNTFHSRSDSHGIIQSLEKSETDPEKSALESYSPTTPDSDAPVRLGRPDIGASIREIVSSTQIQESTIVAACGPNSMMRETRTVIGDLVARSGRSVQLHCEQFGW